MVREPGGVTLIPCYPFKRRTGSFLMVREPGGVTLIPCYPFPSATQPNVILALRAGGCYPDTLGLSAGLLLSHQPSQTAQITQHEVALSPQTSDATARSEEAGAVWRPLGGHALRFARR